MAPVPLEIVLSRMTPQELVEALALLHRCVRVGTVDRAEADRLTRRILALPAFCAGVARAEATLGSRSTS